MSTESHARGGVLRTSRSRDVTSRRDERRVRDRSGDAVRLLRRVRLFESADDVDLVRLVGSSSIASTTKGERVVARGEVGDALYVILRGRFKVAAADSSARQITLSVLGPAEVFGELAIVDGRARSADVVSLQTGSLLVVPRASFMELVGACPSIAWTLTHVVARRLRRLTERIEDRAFLDLEQRLAKRLVEAAEDVGATPDGYLMPGISVGITQQDLAEIVDASRERVNRQLAIWSREGFVSVARSRIHLMDPNAIRRVYDVGPTRSP